MLTTREVSDLLISGYKILKDKIVVISVCIISILAVVLYVKHNDSLEHKRLDELIFVYAKDFGDVNLQIVKSYDENNVRRFEAAHTYIDLIEGKIKALKLENEYSSFLIHHHVNPGMLITPPTNN